MNKRSSSLPITLPLSALAFSAASLQADTSAELQGLQKEFERNLATLRGRVDSLESRVSELEASQFSTTTKLRGTTTFMIGGAPDDNGANSTGFSHRLRLDTSFTGKDRLYTRFTLGLGHTGNANEELNNFGEASDFTSFSAELYYSFPLKNDGFAYVGAGLGYYHFDDEIPTRQDSNNELQDFDFNFGLRYNFDEKFSLSTKNWLSHGGIGGFGRTLRQGVLDNDLTTFYSENYLGYDFGGGLTSTAGFRYKIYDEQERGAGSLDSSDHNFIKEFSLDLGERKPIFYLNGVYGGRSYDNDFTDYDSKYYQVNAGVRGFFPCGVSYDLSGGYEWYDYDDPFFGKKSNGRFEASILGEPRDGLLLAFLLGYGVHNIFPNFGGASFVDPYGWLWRLQLQQTLGNQSDLGVAIEHADLEGRVNTGPNPQFERLSTEIYYNYRISDRITITPSLIYTSIEGNSQDDDFFVGTLRTTFKF